MKEYLNPIINAGLGIRSSVFYWFAGQLWAKEQKSESLPSLFCHEWPEWFSHSCSFVKSNWSELLKSFFKKEQMSEEQWEWFTLGHKKGKNCKNMRKFKNTNFSSKSLVICEQFARIMSESLTSLFCKEQHERFCAKERRANEWIPDPEYIVI